MRVDRIVFCLGAALAAAPLLPSSASASSHREAPFMVNDPALDSTDFYMFRSPTDDPGAADTVTIVANYWPFLDPGGGPNFARWAEDAVYRINIDNDGDAVADIIYEVNFKTEYGADGKSFLYNKGTIESPTDPDLLMWQRAQVIRYELKKGKIDKSKTTSQRGMPTAPFYVGDASYPGTGGRTSADAYEAVAQQAVAGLTTTGGGRFWSGPRDDPFFVDLGSIFDLLSIRPGAPGGTGKGGGIDYLAGYGVLTIALQLPLESITADHSKNPAHGKPSVIGAWTTASRPEKMTMKPGKRPDTKGWVQVSRLGIPLVNEVLVPVGLKDFFNSTEPKDDAKNAAGLLQDPELARLFKALYKLDVPGAGRNDIINLIAFNLGIAPLDVAGLQPADILRLDVSVPAGPLHPKQRMGLLGGDPAGFPNGRRLVDDVVDIEEQVVDGILCGKGKTCTTDANKTPLGDGVDGNDKPFLTHFPYLAAPTSGSAGTAIHAKGPARM